MEKYFLDIEFPGIEALSQPKELEKTKTYHTHLIVHENEIELRIFFNKSEFFAKKFNKWSSKFLPKDFGSLINVHLIRGEHQQHIQKIDLSEARLGNVRHGNLFEGGFEYLIAYIDSVKIYFDSDPSKVNTAEFFMDEKGFRVAKEYYQLFSQTGEQDGKTGFEYKRWPENESFYLIHQAKFRPEFRYNFIDRIDEHNTTIVKKPLFYFNFQNEIDEVSAVKYGDIALTLASFYYNIKIEYNYRRIYLSDFTLVIKNIENKSYLNKYSSFRIFNQDWWNFDKFLQENWQEGTIENFPIVQKTVALFNQSLLVDSYSSFLIRYTIIETCGERIPQNGEWTFLNMNKSKLSAFFENIKSQFISIIEPKEHEAFEDRWLAIKKEMKLKSLKLKFEHTLDKNCIPVKDLPMEVSAIVDLRNKLIHGNNSDVNEKDLIEANNLLYHISGILILNLMGIRNWHFVFQKK